LHPRSGAERDSWQDALAIPPDVRCDRARLESLTAPDKSLVDDAARELAATQDEAPRDAVDDDVTLVNQKISHDPDAEFDNAPEGWKFKLKNRKASAPATDVGEYARATSVDEQGSFAELMEETRSMTPEQVADFLRKRNRVDGEKIMNGREGSGYQMLAGPFSGTM